MNDTRISKMSLDEFTAALAMKAPVPGGGAAAACILAQSAALGSMVIAYTIGKPQFAPHQPRLERLDTFFAVARIEALDLADRDATAYLALSTLWKLHAQDRRAHAQWHTALDEAIASPTAIADLALGVLAALAGMSQITSAQLSSDLQIAKRFAHTALESALLNVQVNLPQLDDLAARESGLKYLLDRRREGARLFGSGGDH
ncbi:MAG: formiminotransferase-cyclodeaminase [Phycisphaerales bacterium]|nr:formiminotransferase-cyclodeaminase [Phycisphaerales bacterium]